MLLTGTVSDFSVADSLEDHRYRELMVAVTGVKPASFDGVDPDDLEPSLDGLMVP